MAISLEEAIAAAASLYPGNQWLFLDNAEQTRAIYREMQRLDLAQVRGAATEAPSVGGTSDAVRDLVA